MKFTSLFTFLLGCSAIANAADSTRVLFIGNSFTGNNDMPGIFQKICKAKNKVVYVEKSWKGGASLKDQTMRPELFSAIQKGNWNFVVIQGWSKEFVQNKEYIDTVTVPYATTIIDSIKTYNPCAQILFYETWGYHDGCEMDSVKLSYEQMSDTIINGYAYMKSMYGFPVVPVGRTWKAFRQKYPDINLYDTDLYHPSKLGSYLSACTFFTCIFHESAEGAVTKTIDYENGLKIQKHCASTLLPELDNLGFIYNYTSIVPRTDANGKHTLQAKAFYPPDAVISWDLGNGKIVKGNTLEYVFPKAGKYVIKLIVKKACGQQTSSYVVSFKAKK